jgi:hypothetical protein
LWFWHSLYFDQTHATIASDTQSLVIAKSWYFNASFGASLQYRNARLHHYWLIVNEYFNAIINDWWCCRI